MTKRPWNSWTWLGSWPGRGGRMVFPAYYFGLRPDVQRVWSSRLYMPWRWKSEEAVGLDRVGPPATNLAVLSLSLSTQQPMITQTTTLIYVWYLNPVAPLLQEPYLYVLHMMFPFEISIPHFLWTFMMASLHLVLWFVLQPQSRTRVPPWNYGHGDRHARRVFQCHNP